MDISAGSASIVSSLITTQTALVVTYYDCTAALDGSFGARAHVVQPFDASLASSAQLHLDVVGIAVPHRSFEDSRPSGSGPDRIR